MNLNNAGITLISLLITVIILIILSAIAISIGTKAGWLEIAIAGAQKYSVEQVREREIADELKQQIEDPKGMGSTKRYVSEELRKMLDATNQIVEVQDVVTPSFYQKMSSNKEAMDRILKLVVTKANDEQVLLDLNANLIPNVNNNQVMQSTYYNSGGTYCPGYYAFNNTTSYWCSAYGKQNNAYLGYNFQTEKSVCLMRVYNGNLKHGANERCKEVVLQYSDDNENWLDASEIITLPNSNEATDIWNTKEKNKHQYWRIYIISSYGNYSSIYKIKFYGG